MDINPYQFTAPWSDYEFATTMLNGCVDLVVLSMAWLTLLSPQELEFETDKPDMQTVAYWVERFHPFTEAGKDAIVVFANRCGTEGNRVVTDEEDGGDQVCYAGSSCVMKFQNGGVRMFERNEGVAILGKGEEGVLVVDTSQHAKYSLTSTRG